MSSRFSRKEKLFFLLFSLIFALTSIIVVRTITQLFIDKEIGFKKEKVRNHLTLVRSNIETIIYKDTYLADSLATVVTLDHAFATKNWSMIAEKLLKKALYVRNVGLAPNNVITHIYPLEGNESAIGFDFRTHPEQLKTVQLAEELQGVYIAGPLELVQGGIALIARYPIFSDFPLNKDYWGTVSIVIDYHLLLQKSGISDFQGADIAIKKQSLNPDTLDKVFYGNSEIFQQADALYPINLPNGKWLMAAKMDLNSFGDLTLHRRILNALGAITAILAYLSVVLLYRNYQYARTASLQDELTKLPNRRFVMEQLKRAISKQDNDTGFTLLNIDLNDFKRVNDQLGHEAGDELLRHVAHKLSDNIRATDTVARIGGDEFLVILSGITDDALANHIVQKLRNRVEATAMQWQNDQIFPSLSIGKAIYHGQQITVKQLLVVADEAMYQAKQQRKHADWTI